MATPAFNPDLLIGPLEIGVLIDFLLFGALTTQTYNYYKAFSNDNALIKTVVAIIWCCELGQVLCVAHSLYVFTVTFYGHPEAFIRPPQSLVTAILFSGLISPLVQAFFANRIRGISKRLIIPVICWILSSLRFLGSVIAFGVGVQMKTLASYEKQWGWLLTAVLAVGVTVDIIIALSLCYYLYDRRKSLILNNSTAKVIDRLIVWTLQTGLPPSILGLTELACFLIMGDNSIWLGMFMFYSKLFSITLLASLNARKALRGISTNVVELTTIHDTHMSFGQTPLSMQLGSLVPSDGTGTTGSNASARKVGLEKNDDHLA